MIRRNYPRPTPDEIADDREQAIVERTYEVMASNPDLTEAEARAEAEWQIDDETERARDAFYASEADARAFDRSYVSWRM